MLNTFVCELEDLKGKEVQIGFIGGRFFSGELESAWDDAVILKSTEGKVYIPLGAISYVLCDFDLVPCSTE